MSEGEPAVTVVDLTKRYEAIAAVDRLSFQVTRGSIYGLLGPNGAGKTTTLECLEGLRSPDSGMLRVSGIDPVRHPKSLWNMIGVQLQESGLPRTMTVIEAIGFFCRYHGISPREGVLDRFGLSGIREKQYGDLSTGQRRRLALALAVVHNPQVLLLDEPTAGLDVESRTELHALMLELKSEGRTILLSTHDMAEAEKLCDSIGIIIGGRMAAEGSPARITAAGNTRTRIRLASRRSSLLHAPPAIPGVQPVDAEPGYAAYLAADPASAVIALLEYLTACEDKLEDLRVERPTLEERFMEITAGGERRERI